MHDIRNCRLKRVCEFTYIILIFVVIFLHTSLLFIYIKLYTVILKLTRDNFAERVSR